MAKRPTPVPASTTLTSLDPWDGSAIATFPIATRREVGDAVERGRNALAGWSRDAALREHCITTLGEKLVARREDLALLISRETGKVHWESRLEVDAMVNKCALSIRAQAERRSPTSKEANGITQATTYRPHGVAVVIGPFNFPGHLPLGHIAPALLAGNTVLFKPSDKAPAVGQFLTDLIHESGVPTAAFQTLHGSAETATALLDADINAVMFTGSYMVGTAILSRFTTRPGVLLALELGGNNPLIAWDVKEDSIAAAVLTILQSAFATGGQRCSCARRLILPSDSPLLKPLLFAADTLRPGRFDDDPQPFYGTLISAAAVAQTLSEEETLSEIPESRYRDRRLLVRGKRDPRSPALLSPSIIDSTDLLNWDPIDYEIFGPLLQVFTVGDFKEAIKVANRTDYGLVAGLLTDKFALWEEFRHTARAGVLTLNRPTVGASSELPFGGIGFSGNHRPSAYFAADYCSYPVAEMSSEKLSLPEKLPPGIRLS